jgi:hypothetical protein
MEGSYNKVLSASATTPYPSYGFFVSILANTVRYVHMVDDDGVGMIDMHMAIVKRLVNVQKLHMNIYLLW